MYKHSALKLSITLCKTLCLYSCLEYLLTPTSFKFVTPIAAACIFLCSDNETVSIGLYMHALSLVVDDVLCSLAERMIMGVSMV